MCNPGSDPVLISDVIQWKYQSGGSNQRENQGPGLYLSVEDEEFLRS